MKHRRRQHLPTSAPERYQVAGKIPAVDRRYISGIEWTKIARVIPIVEMPAESLQAAHRRKCFFEPIDRRREAQPAEIPRGKHGKKIEAQIGRRGAVRDDRVRILLIVVRRKHVVFRRHECFEEVPSAARREAQAFRLSVRQRAPVGTRRSAHPPGDGRRQHPGAEQRTCDQPDPILGVDDGKLPTYSQHDSAQHAPIESGHTELPIGTRRRRRHPLQQLSTPIQPRQRADDRIDHQPGLVREQRRLQAELERGNSEFQPKCAEVAAGRNAGLAWNDARNERQVRRYRKREKNETGPEQCSHRGQQNPPDYKRDETRWRRQGAPEIVDELPAAQRRNIRPAAGGRRLAHEPRKQLPVAARPSVLARCGHVVTRRKILKDLNVRNQPRAGKNTLKQVVTENRAFRDAACECGFEGIHIVDALAAVGALFEQVLVNVGHRGRVWVDAGRARKHALIKRTILRGRKRRRHPRLQHAITLDDAAGRGIEPGPIKRVRHFPDQAFCSANRQPRVAVQGNDITHARRHKRRLAAHGQERSVGRAAQQPVQLMQFSSLAFPTDPFALTFVPEPPAMEQEKAWPIGRWPVLPV